MNCARIRFFPTHSDLIHMASFEQIAKFWNEKTKGCYPFGGGNGFYHVKENTSVQKGSKK